MSLSSSVISPGLALINDYSSDDDDEITDEISKTNQEKERLPLPSSIFKVELQSSEDHVDDISAHDGRIRSFPHQRGNWATYVYIPFDVTERYNSFTDIIITNIGHSLELKAVENPHISLTRTVVLLHHWIDSFVKTIEERLKHVIKFNISFGSLSVYTNEEKTRTFIGLDVAHGSQLLVAVVNDLNSCLKEFNLEMFYDVPSFHMSFLWCLGDQKRTLEASLPLMEKYFQEYASAYPEFQHLHVSNCCCKTGNKYFNFKFRGL